MQQNNIADSSSWNKTSSPLHTISIPLKIEEKRLNKQYKHAKW